MSRLRWIGSWVVIAGTLTASVVIAQQGKGPLSNARLGRRDQIFGPRTNIGDARGKVILLYYLGSTGARGSSGLANLVSVQRQYNASGRFMVIASHVQDGPSEAVERCASHTVNFPVFQQLIIRNARPNRTLPHAYLFDHTGQIVSHGKPSVLQPEIAGLIRAAGPVQSEMLEGVTLDHFARYNDDFQPGQAIRSPLQAVENKMDNDDVGDEAAAMTTELQGLMASAESES